MTGTYKWHSCSSHDFPLKRHKVSKACDACRSKKMRCDGKLPCERCGINKIECKYDDKPSTRSRTKINTPINNRVKEYNHRQHNSKDYLEEITFANDLFETLRLHQHSKTDKYGTSIPPLLFDFFNITSQPYSIWLYFIQCLDKLSTHFPGVNYNALLRDIPENESIELIRQTIDVFITHNYLYSTFIDHTRLSSTIHSSFSCSDRSTSHSRKQDSSLDYPLILIYSILALTFYSACQSLPMIDESLSRHLYMYSRAFYKEAHTLFLQACFPVSVSYPELNKKDNMPILLLIQTSILLAHFQCVAIDDEQAYMTIKMGIDLFQSQKSIDPSDEECICSRRCLEGWYVWLTFYLRKSYLPELDSSRNQSKEMKSTTVPPDLFKNKNDKQKSALHVTLTHTTFLKDLLQKRYSANLSTKTIKEAITKLDVSNLSSGVPATIIAIYRSILTIQIFNYSLIHLFHKLDDSLGDRTPDALSVDSTLSEPSSTHSTHAMVAVTQNDVELPKEGMATLEVCFYAAQDILTNVNKILDVGYNFRAPDSLHYVPVSIVYSICLVSSLVISLLQYKKYLNELDESLESTEKKKLNIHLLCDHLTSTLKLTSRMDFSAIISDKLSELLWENFIPLEGSPELQDQNTPIGLTSMLSTHTPPINSFTNDPVSNTLFNEFLVPNPTHTGRSKVLSRPTIDKEQLEKLSRKPENHYIDTSWSDTTVAAGQKRLNNAMMFDENLDPFNQKMNKRHQSYLGQYPPCSSRVVPNNRLQENHALPQNKMKQDHDYPSDGVPIVSARRSNRNYPQHTQLQRRQSIQQQHQQHQQHQQQQQQQQQESRSNMINYMALNNLPAENVSYQMMYGDMNDMNEINEIMNGNIDTAKHYAGNEAIAPDQYPPLFPPQPPEPMTSMSSHLVDSKHLPQPSKQVTAQAKGWFAPAQVSNKLFASSEKQTLHTGTAYHHIEPTFTTNINTLVEEGIPTSDPSDIMMNFNMENHPGRVYTNRCNISENGGHSPDSTTTTTSSSLASSSNMIVSSTLGGLDAVKLFSPQSYLPHRNSQDCDLMGDRTNTMMAMNAEPASLHHSWTEEVGFQSTLNPVFGANSTPLDRLVANNQERMFTSQWINSQKMNFGEY
ncbi:hypothetical protein BDB01DRAFT_830690 [Pilobolus umbonatus]|nr:hypothetical protein BDB01DRAFT_830690 [Pilobolus umbonatus]